MIDSHGESATSTLDPKCTTAEVVIDDSELSPRCTRFVLRPKNRMPSYLTARQAAKLLGSTPRTASRRAKEAAEKGDPTVIRLGRAWGAPESWWREQLKPKPMGPPRRHADQS